MNARDAVRQRMAQDGASPLLQATFLHYYDQLVSGATGLIDRTMIAPVDTAPDAEGLTSFESAGRAALRQTVMLKLNGGLGTGMGLDKAKSLLPVRAGLSFLDLIAGQILALRRRLEGGLPLVFMNSFSTEADTLAALARHPDLAAGQPGIPLSFLQNRVPKIEQAGFAPAAWPADPAKTWCPPGHGDLYTALLTTGLLDRLLAGGFEYLFVSNADNLGATLDLEILGYFAARRFPFMMEVADRTEADRKGGHVARLADGRLILRESAQCPPGEADDFQDIRRYRYFNTNNLWINLRALKAELDARGGILGLPLIRNAKTVDPTDPGSPPVFQLETAMGSAISVFKDASVLRVPRARFAPVKTTDDLLALWSDCFLIDDTMTVRPNPARRHGTIVIRLDSRYFKMIRDFLARFPAGAPSLLECEALTVTGDVRFGGRVTIRGRATIENPGPGQRLIENVTLG